MFHLKLIVWAAIGAASMLGMAHRDADATESRRDIYLSQLYDRDEVPALIRNDYAARNLAYAGVGITWAALGGLMFSREVGDYFKKLKEEIQ